MRYQACEQDIVATIRNFEALCTYIEDNRPTLTAKGDLSTKACFELNSLMARPEHFAKRTDRMAKYWTVSLYFILARESGLLEPYSASSQKTAVKLSEKYSAYREMNVFSKYPFLFLIWMCDINIEDLYGDRTLLGCYGGAILDRTFRQMGEIDHPAKLTHDDKHNVFDDMEQPLLTLMYACPAVLRHFRDLGLISYDEADEINTTSYGSHIDTLTPTQFGITLSRACNVRRFTWVNRWEEWILSLDEDAEDMDLFEKEYQKNQPGTKGFFLPLLSCFPKDSVDTATLNTLLFPPDAGASDNALYAFKVALRTGCYRVIHCAGSRTFEDLHLAIQDAFEFDNDHLYSFFLDGKR